MAKIDIDIEYAKSIFDYNPDTGLLTRTAQTGWRSKVGDIAGFKRPDGYVQVRLKSTKLLAHRIAYAIFHNKQPINIDHINGNPSDNRICNLRECNQSENIANRAACKTNKSGYKGVSWNKQHNKWVVYIQKDGKGKYLGLYENINEAAKSYADAAKLYHGEFAKF